MDYKVLYRKYRPKNFSELMGQNNIKELLLNSIINNKVSHAYLFTGPRGTGKTSTAKIFAKTINCQNLVDNNPCETCSFCLSYNDSPDIIEIDAASNNGVDEIRELRENIKILPTNSKYKIYIIDEVHMLSSSAWNAFLKTLEEPPSHVIFILATTETQKIPITVLSRCQRFDFQRISEDVIAELINKIAINEKIDVDYEAIVEISKLSDGGLRDALSILDQLSKSSDKITLETIKDAYGIVSSKDLDELFTNFFENKVKLVVDKINYFKKTGVDSNILINKLLEYLLDTLINNKISNVNKYDFINNLIIDIESCFLKSNQYILVATMLIKYMDTTNEEEAVSENQLELNSYVSTDCIENNISREILNIDDLKPVNITNSEKPTQINQEIIDIRINNSFAGADIELKKQFNKNWEILIKHLFQNNDYKLASLLKDTKVEVVSPTNILLSTDSYSNSVLLNSFSDQISNYLKKEFNLNVKVVCLDNSSWLEEKSNYIKNIKEKNYEFILEPINSVNEEIINSAEDIFGDQLVEIN